MKKLCLLIAIAELSAAILLVGRQRSLKELQAENEALRSEILAASANSSTPSATLTATTPATALAPQEKSELLRLRGQIGALRRQLQAVQSQGK